MGTQKELVKSQLEWTLASFPGHVGGSIEGKWSGIHCLSCMSIPTKPWESVYVLFANGQYSGMLRTGSNRFRSHRNTWK